MRGAVIYGAGDVRFEDLPEPEIVAPTDAIIRTTATCVCGSDLWDYRGINAVAEPKPFGHEYCGVIEAVGSEVTSVKPGQFVIGSFYASDGTCPNCRNGVQSSCVHRVLMGGC
jgi:threonine dehydrogenase-like Zn-dependent dehydrogenase